MIKVETKGDDTRASAVRGRHGGLHAANQGKRGITADFREPSTLMGQALIAEADIGENFKTGG